MKNVKVVSLALGLGVSLSLVSAFDLSNVGKALEKAQDAGVITTGIPTQKQFDDKVIANAKANTKECKKFYHSELLEYGGVLEGMLAERIKGEERENIRDLLGEWNRTERKALGKFDIKPLVSEYTKNKKNRKIKDKLHEVCHVILGEGLSQKEREEFADETYEKYNALTGTEIPRNKKK